MKAIATQFWQRQLNKLRDTDRLGAAVLLTMAAGIAIRFWGLGHQSLWVDEGYTLELTAKNSIRDLIVTLTTSGASDSFMPGYEIVLYFWRGLFGSSVEAARALSAVFGSAALVVCTMAAWRNWGRKAALWTAALAGSSAYALYYSQEARSYASLHLISASLLLVYLECRSPRANRWWRLGLAGLAGLAMWFNIFSVIFLVLLVLADLVLTRSFRVVFRLWWLPALSAMSYGLWFLMLLSHQTIGTYYPLSETSGLLKIGYLASGLIAGASFGPPPESMRMGADRSRRKLGLRRRR